MSAALAVSLAGLAGCVQLNENFIVQFSVTRRTDNQTHRSTTVHHYTVHSPLRHHHQPHQLLVDVAGHRGGHDLMVAPGQGGAAPRRAAAAAAAAE